MFLRVGSCGVHTPFGAWFWYGCVGGMHPSRRGSRGWGSRPSSFGGGRGFGGGGMGRGGGAGRG